MVKDAATTIMNVFRSPPHGREVLSHGGRGGGQGEASTPGDNFDQFCFILISSHSLGSSSGNLLRMLSMPWGLTGLAVVLPGGDFCKNKERKGKIRDNVCECGWLQFTRARGWKRWR